MGKIKSKLVKRTAENLTKQGVEFTESFNDNKQILGNNTMPGKKLRNQIAGYAIRIKKEEKKKLEALNANSSNN